MAGTSGKAKTSLVKSWLGAAIVLALPALLLIDDPSLIKYMVPYAILAVAIGAYSGWLITKEKQPSYFHNLITGSLFLLPFLIFSAYPIGGLSILLSCMVVILGFGVPFVSKKLTWWLYTLGGRLPLPSAHSWLEDNTSKNSNESYTEFVAKTTGLAGTLGLMLYYLLFRNKSVTEVLIFMKLIGLIVSLGIGLTLGTDLKRRLLLTRK